MLFKSKVLITLMLILFLQFFASAQKYRGGLFDIGLAIGAANYSGDLSQKNINIPFTRPMIGIYGRKSLSPYFQWRIQASYAQLAADDAKSKNYKQRNINFKTDLIELNSTIEFNFLKYGINSSSKELDFTSYVFLGLGAFYFNPKAVYNDQEISLRDLRTENKSYARVQPAIPYGIGIKFSKTRRFELGFEIGMRKLMTDYLDDVSGNYPNYNQLEADRGLASARASHPQVYNGNLPANPGQNRGDNHLTDYYMFTNITLSFRFVKRDACPY